MSTKNEKPKVAEQEVAGSEVNAERIPPQPASQVTSGESTKIVPDDDDDDLEEAPKVVSVDPLHEASVKPHIDVNALLLAHAAVLLRTAHRQHVYSNMEMHIEPKGIKIQGIYFGRVMHQLVTWEELHNVPRDNLSAPEGNPIIAAIKAMGDNLKMTP